LSLLWRDVTPPHAVKLTQDHLHAYCVKLFGPDFSSATSRRFWSAMDPTGCAYVNRSFFDHAVREYRKTTVGRRESLGSITSANALTKRQLSVANARLRHQRSHSPTTTPFSRKFETPFALREKRRGDAVAAAAANAATAKEEEEAAGKGEDEGDGTFGTLADWLPRQRRRESLRRRSKLNEVFAAHKLSLALALAEVPGPGPAAPAARLARRTRTHLEAAAREELASGAEESRLLAAEDKKRRRSESNAEAKLLVEAQCSLQDLSGRVKELKRRLSTQKSKPSSTGGGAASMVRAASMPAASTSSFSGGALVNNDGTDNKDANGKRECAEWERLFGEMCEQRYVIEDAEHLLREQCKHVSALEALVERHAAVRQLHTDTIIPTYRGSNSGGGGGDDDDDGKGGTENDAAESRVEAVAEQGKRKEHGKEKSEGESEDKGKSEAKDDHDDHDDSEDAGGKARQPEENEVEAFLRLPPELLECARLWAAAEVDAAEAKAVRGAWVQAEGGEEVAKGHRGGKKKELEALSAVAKGAEAAAAAAKGALEAELWGFEASEAKARHDADEALLSLQDGFFRCHFELHAAFAATAASSPSLKYLQSSPSLPSAALPASPLQSSSASSAPSPSSVDEISYSALPVIRAAATRVFDMQVGRSLPDPANTQVAHKNPMERNARKWEVLVGKCWPEQADEGFYSFKESSLGQILFNRHGEVSMAHWDKFAEILPFGDQHLRGNRQAWGALLTSLVNQWKEPVHFYRQQCAESLRYVVFDEAVREMGFAALLREDWRSLSEKGDEAELKAAQLAARRRFQLSKLMRDEIGVDFFVSHNWKDDNAPHRWATLLVISDRFQRRFGRLPRFWLDRFCIDQSQQTDIALKTSILPATLMSCKATLVLQSPFYLGCSQPPALASLWCILEFFTLCSLAPHDNPRENLLWVPLFDGANIVPPELDLVHSRVYCFSPDDKEKLLANVSSSGRE
jgi:hypothetical protein